MPNFRLLHSHREWQLGGTCEPHGLALLPNRVISGVSIVRHPLRWDKVGGYDRDMDDQPERLGHGKPYRKIIPLNINPGEMIQLHHATRKIDRENNTIIYSHIVYPQDGGHGTKIIWKKTFPKGVRRKINAVVQAFLEERIADGYFRSPRLALSIYLELHKKLPNDVFSIADLDKGLAVLTRIGGPLIRSKIDTQLHYCEALLSMD